MCSLFARKDVLCDPSKIQRAMFCCNAITTRLREHRPASRELTLARQPPARAGPAASGLSPPATSPPRLRHFPGQHQTRSLPCHLPPRSRLAEALAAAAAPTSTQAVASPRRRPPRSSRVAAGIQLRAPGPGLCGHSCHSCLATAASSASLRHRPVIFCRSPP